jgi:hypothetical protein
VARAAQSLPPAELDRLFGIERPKIACFLSSPKKTRVPDRVVSPDWAQTQGPCQSGGLVRFQRWHRFPRRPECSLSGDRSLFDVDFTIGDDSLRFARMDCSGLWVPAGSDDVTARWPRRPNTLRAEACRERRRSKRTPSSSEKPINAMAKGSKGPRKLSKTRMVHRLPKASVGIFRHYAPCQPGMRPTVPVILNRDKLPI